MRELLIRTLSGAVLVALVIGSILVHPLAYAVFLLFVVAVGTFEMGRLNAMVEKRCLCFVEVLAVVSFALSSLAAVGILPPSGGKQNMEHFSGFTKPGMSLGRVSVMP